MDDEKEGTRMSLKGAGPLLGQLHSLPFAEAEWRVKGLALDLQCECKLKKKQLVTCVWCRLLTMRGCCGCKGTNWLKGVRCGGWWEGTDGVGCNTKCSLEISGGKA